MTGQTLQGAQTDSDRRRRSAGSRKEGSLKLQLAAEPKSVFAARQALSRHVMGEKINLERVRTAVSEAVGNAVKHAYPERPPGPVELRAEWTDGGLLVQVSDEGVGMRPRVGGPGLGLGLALIGKVSDRYEITEGSGITVTMFFKRQSASAAAVYKGG